MARKARKKVIAAPRHLPPARWLFSIDPGDDDGGATYGLWDCLSTPPALVECGPWGSLHWQPYPDCVAIIESQIIVPRFTSRPADIITLAWEAGAISACFGGPKSPRVKRVAPSSWKQGCPKPRKTSLWATYVIHRRVEKSLDARELALYRQALDGFPDGERHNLADGVGIGLSHHGRLRT